MKCICGYKLGVHKDGAGWYIGVFTEDGPWCCCSDRHYATRELAEQELVDGTFRVRRAEETEWCNGGIGCLVYDDYCEDDSYEDCDYEIGYDPYMGCYSDDC